MTPPRFQFTIKGLLLATFWVAASCAAVATLVRNSSAFNVTVVTCTAVLGLGLAFDSLTERSGEWPAKFVIKLVLFGLAFSVLTSGFR